MADKPIPFSAPMVRAILREIEAPGSGKTQTRRFPKILGHGSFSEFGLSDTPGYDWHFRDSGMLWHDLRHTELLDRLPYCRGDRLWVREAWRTGCRLDHKSPAEIVADCREAGYLRPWAPIRYESDGQKENWIADPHSFGAEPGRYRQGMHMPRPFSRLTLHVTDVRVQRLQDISLAEAMEEGVERYGLATWMNYQGRGVTHCTMNPKDSFKSLWESLNAKRAPWASNPWVVAITFRPALGNIDGEGQ